MSSNEVLKKDKKRFEQEIVEKEEDLKALGYTGTYDEMVNAYGADSLRCYELFIGDYEKDAAWSE